MVAEDISAEVEVSERAEDLVAGVDFLARDFGLLLGVADGGGGVV